MHRIFIAINLPEKIKENLSSYSWDLPAKWVKKDNLHLTLAFLGNRSDKEIEEIISGIKKLALKHSPFKIKLNKIVYDSFPPRVIWARGDLSEELASLKKDLNEELGLTKEKKLIPHITLGRIRKWQWQRIEPEERVEINEDINLDFEVNSVEVMESFLKRSGPEYIILESIKL